MPGKRDWADFVGLVLMLIVMMVLSTVVLVVFDGLTPLP